MKSLAAFSLMLVTILSTAFSAPNFPFPQQAKYQYGVMPTGVSPRHVQSVYEIWLDGYYERLSVGDF